MCLVVWRELYSCLSHSFHDNSKTETQQDQQIDEIDNMSDKLEDGSFAAANIQHSTPFVMETIQRRVKQLVNTPISSVSSDSQVMVNQSKEETDDHTSMESADNSLHQVIILHLALTSSDLYEGKNMVQYCLP